MDAVPLDSPLSLSLLSLCFRTNQQPRFKHGSKGRWAVLKTQPGSSCFQQTPAPPTPSAAHRMGAWVLGARP